MPSEPLPSHLCEQLQSLLCGLTELYTLLGSAFRESAPLSPSPRSPSAVTFQRQVTQLQQQFQQILAIIASLDLDPAVEQRLRPHQTEAHRRSRLLGIEAMRLQTAKQPATINRQRSQVEDHVKQLQKFVQAMVDEIC